MAVNAARVRAPFALAREQDPVPAAPSLSEVFGAAFSQVNTVGSLWARVEGATEDELRPSHGPDEQDFDAFEGIEGTVFERQPESLIGVASSEERDRVRARVERELEDRQTLTESGLLGFGAAMVSGVLDPVLIFPLTGAATKVRALALAGKLATGAGRQNMLAGGLLTARAGFMGETAAQSVLLATQETRTLGESAVDVTAATVLSGMLGSAVGLLSEGSRRLARDRIQRELGGGAGKVDEISARDLEPRIDSDGNVTSDAEPKVKRALFGVEKLMAKTPAITSPFLRVLVKSASPTMKRTMLELGDSSARLVEGLNLGRSVESDVLAWDAILDQAVTANDRLFTSYRRRKAGKAGEARLPRVERNLIRMGDRLAGRDPVILSHKEFLEHISRALRSGDRSHIPEVQEAAELWRSKLFDPIADDLIELGRLPETIQATGPLGATSYLTRIYKAQQLIAREFEFKEGVLRPWFRAKLDADDLDAIAKSGEDIETVVRRETDSIFENMTGLNPGRVIIDPVSGSSPSPLKPRVLDIGDELLTEWLEKDIEVIAERYVRTVVPDVMIQKRFGSTDLEAQRRVIADEYKEARAAAKTEKARLNLAKQQNKDLKLLDDLVQILRNTYTGGARVPLVVTPLRVARSINFMAFGGGMMISSIPDIGMVVLRNGLGRTFRTGILPLVTHFGAVRLAAKEVRLAGAGLDFTLDSRSRFWYEIGDEYATSRIQRAARSAANNFGILNLLSPWNTVMKRWSGTILQTRLLEALDNLRLGRPVSARDLGDLDFLRLTADQRTRIGEMIGAHGIESGGALKWVNTTAWEDVDAREAFRAAIRFGVDQTIITPGLLDRPPMMSTELGRTVGQFLSFAMSATNRVMLTSLQNPRDLATLNGLALMLALGMGVQWLKRTQAGQDLPETPEAWIKAGVDRSGMIGIYGDIYNKTAPLFGADRLSSRYAARNLMSSLLGPTAGLGESAFRFIGSVREGDFTESEVRNARRLLPYNQLFYVRSLFDMAEEGVNDAFHIPKRRRQRR